MPVSRYLAAAANNRYELNLLYIIYNNNTDLLSPYIEMQCKYINFESSVSGLELHIMLSCLPPYRKVLQSVSTIRINFEVPGNRTFRFI